MLGWWLAFSMVIATGYQSTLIAHLTIQSKSKPPETFKDLVKADNWEWATEPWLFRGYAYVYLSQHKDPYVIEVFKVLQVSS